jgi:ferredoxin
MMQQQNKARFVVDTERCTGCGRCVDVCSGQVLSMVDGVPEIKPFERFGWSGCWKCQHCLAVCPVGAVSVLGRRPEDSLPRPNALLGEQMDRLVAYRRSCRRYQSRNVERDLMDRILKDMENVPTGGNSMGLEMTIIDDIDELDRIWRFVYDGMEANAARGIYSAGMSRSMYQTMKRSESALRKDDLLFCGAPHLFIAHKRAKGQWAQDDIADCNIASAYFELICNAHGLTWPARAVCSASPTTTTWASSSVSAIPKSYMRAACRKTAHRKFTASQPPLKNNTHAFAEKGLVSPRPQLEP